MPYYADILLLSDPLHNFTSHADSMSESSVDDNVLDGDEETVLFKNMQGIQHLMRDINIFIESKLFDNNESHAKCIHCLSSISRRLVVDLKSKKQNDIPLKWYYFMLQLCKYTHINSSQEYSFIVTRLQGIFSYFYTKSVCCDALKLLESPNDMINFNVFISPFLDIMPVQNEKSKSWKEKIYARYNNVTQSWKTYSNA